MVICKNVFGILFVIKILLNIFSIRLYVIKKGKVIGRIYFL